MSALQYVQREEYRVHGRATGDSHSVSDVKSTLDSTTEEEFRCKDASYDSDVNSSTEPVCDYMPFDRDAKEYCI